MKKRKKKYSKLKSDLTPKQIEHRKFISSKKWSEIKKNLFSIRERKCEECNRTIGLQVHHLTYDRFGGEELLEDLQILCAYHHMLVHGFINPKHNKGKKYIRSKKKHQYPYENILTIYPEVMAMDVSEHQKALAFRKIFHTGKKLIFKDGRIRKKQCIKYLRKMKQIYTNRKDKRPKLFDVEQEYGCVDDDNAPCLHYVT